MTLDDEQRQRIRDEEFFREEVRKSLGSDKAPPTLLARMGTFFETKAGFWLLTTALAGGGAWAYAKLDHYVHRTEIEARERAEQERSDIETLVRMGPLLTAKEPASRAVSVILLTGLANARHHDAKVRTTAEALLAATIAGGGAAAESVFAYGIDSGSLGGAATSSTGTASSAASGQPTVRPTDPAPTNSATASVDALPPVAPTTAAAIADVALPPRIYVQIGSDEDRPRAEAESARLRDKGYPVPGIERVRRAPDVAQVRYCTGRVEPEAIARVKAATADATVPPPVMVPLTLAQCGKSRYNHFELWYPARRDAS